MHQQSSDDADNGGQSQPGEAFPQRGFEMVPDQVGILDKDLEHIQGRRQNPEGNHYPRSQELPECEQSQQELPRSRRPDLL